MKRRAWSSGLCAAVLAVTSAHAGDPGDWVQPVLRMGLSFGAPVESCGSSSEWTAGFDLQSTFESQIEARDTHPEASLPDTLASPQTPMPLFGLRSRCGDVRQLRAFGFDVIDAEGIGSR